MKNKISIVVLLCLAGKMIMAQEWVTFTKSTPESPIIILIQSNNQQVEFTAEVCGIFKQNLVQQSEIFQRIEIPGAGKSMETGEPELPYIRQLIAIPECDDVLLSVNITGQLYLNNYNIYPAPSFEEVQEPGGLSYMQEVFTKDETVYSHNIYLTGINAAIVSTGYLRDQKYAEVFLYPVQFNPVTKQLKVFTHFQVTLNFTNPSTVVNFNTGIFNNVATHTMLNYVSSGITATINDNVQGSGNVQWIELTEPEQADNIVADYLIICSDHFFEPNNPESEVLRIANHRATYNGFDVAILNANTVISDAIGFYYEGAPDPQYKYEQRIRTCIRRIYEGENALHTYDGKLGYVLLIGDSDYGTNLGMPTSYMYTHEYIDPNGVTQYINYASDYHYSCITKIEEYDPIGDIFVGRFCVDNDENGEVELSNMVNKTIFYESEYIFDDWRKNVVFANGLDPENNWSNIFSNYYNFIESIIAEPYNLNIYNAILSGAWNVKGLTIQSLNEGCFFMFYLGHGYDDGWYINGTTGPPHITEFDFESNAINNIDKYPVALGSACYSGYFDYEADCFAEFTTTYENKGFVGYLGSSRMNFMGLGNQLIMIETCIPSAIFNDLSHITGEFILEGKINAWGFNQRYGYNYFGDPALNIMASGFEITKNTVLPQSTTISSDIKVRSGATLSIPSSGIIYFENNGKLTIDEGATIVIGNNAEFIGNNLSQLLVIEGNFLPQLQGEFYFHSQEGTMWGGLTFTNSGKSYGLTNFNFENCYLSGVCKQLSLSNCTFNNSRIKYQKGDLIISNSNFDNSKIEVKFGSSKSSFVEIKSGCTIQNCESEPAIFIDSYYKYTIDDCIVSGNYGDAIGIYNSGSFRGVNDIKNNSIINNGWLLGGSGIELYRSYANINGDQLIEGNTYGISCFDKSNVTIIGNSSAHYVYETQIIRNNDKHQLFATQNSFPFDFKWNAIYDEDNIYPLVYYSSIIPQQLKVSNNYWGINFIPQSDLYPWQYYTYLPIWPLGGGGSGSGAEALYLSAQENIEDGEYAAAKADYEQIVSDYPESMFSQASLRELWSIEEEVSDDYSTLKTYYNTDTNIINNPELTKLADFLANFCEIKLENWPTAIAWFEDVIQNPESLEDSIFAIIDMGYTYWLMENGGLKSTYMGRMGQYKFSTREEFEANRDFLLSLLPGDQLSETMKQSISTLKSGELLQNVPNPFNGTTQIWFKLAAESDVTVRVYDYTGKEISDINSGMMDKGSHSVEFKSENLPTGIYFYTLEVNGLKTDTKKMTLIK
jgi:hypothetical protein